jgi:hypothetical protein
MIVSGVMKQLYRRENSQCGYVMNGRCRAQSLAVAVLFYAGILLSVLFVTGYELGLLQTKCLVCRICQKGIDYEAFRNVRITDEIIGKMKRNVSRILHRYPKLAGISPIDFPGYLTFYMMASDFDLKNCGVLDETTFLRGIGEVAQTKDFQELYQCYRAIFTDLKYFPVPKIAAVKGKAHVAKVTYSDSWYALRSYGGKRRHEGTDLMADNNIRGYFPVVSITDGVIENLGWLEKGGNRIGIRAKAGGYFYYAHLYSFAPKLHVGDSVIAGRLLGFMGDSGYGPKGTVGQFDVHLHVGIYVHSGMGDTSVNPYWILKTLEKKRFGFTLEK